MSGETEFVTGSEGVPPAAWGILPGAFSNKYWTQDASNARREWVASGAFLAQVLPKEFKPFASPYDIPFLPLWAVITLTILATLIGVALIWWLQKRWKKSHTPPPPPRQAALESLNALQPHIETDAPSEFTVEVASVLRRFVVGQYGIPATRQTSQEFLQSLAQSAAFSESDQTLLKSFLDKSDLIEFAKLQATSEDNRDLWEKAREFVQERKTA